MLKIKRNGVFDIIRGLAVLSMVFANCVPVYSGDEMPLILRFICSVAAPIFVMISGFMISQMAHRHSYSYFITKGMFVFLIGILIDIFINNIKPLEGFDILYLLGISLPIAALAAKYSRNLIIALIALILVTGTFLRNYFGYHDVVINDIDFTNSAIFPDKIPFHCWFIDGWFPIFPWLACMLSGVAFGKTYEMHNKDMSLFQDYKYLLGTIALFLVGIAFFITYPSEMIPRHGYIEIFYPLSIGLFISLVSFAFIILFILDFVQNYKIVNLILKPLGVGALSIYIIHLAIIGYIIKPMLVSINSMDIFTLVFVAHVTALLIITSLFQKFKNTYTKLPTVVYWLIGK